MYLWSAFFYPEAECVRAGFPSAATSPALKISVAQTLYRFSFEALLAKKRASILEAGEYELLQVAAGLRSGSSGPKRISAGVFTVRCALVAALDLRCQ